MSTLKQKYKVQIFAADIDKEAIDMARTGYIPTALRSMYARAAEPLLHEESICV